MYSLIDKDQKKILKNSFSAENGLSKNGFWSQHENYLEPTAHEVKMWINYSTRNTCQHPLKAPSKTPENFWIYLEDRVGEQKIS